MWMWLKDDVYGVLVELTFGANLFYLFLSYCVQYRVLFHCDILTVHSTTLCGPIDKESVYT